MKTLKQFFLFFILIATSFAINAQTARVQVIHNSADTAASTVDVWIDNTLTLDDVDFRTATPFLTVPSNVNLDITVQPSNSTDTVNGLFQQTINLDSNESYIVIANGIISSSGYTPNEPFGLNIYPMAQDTSIGGASETDVLVFHGSTDAGPVDVYESSVPAGTIVDNASYGDFAGYLALVTADYTIQIRDSFDSKIVAAYEAPLSTLSLGGSAITVVASGFLDSTQNSNGPSFGLYVALPAGGALVPLPSASIPTARLQAVHNSADAAAEKVDVWLNDEVLIDNFEFRTASPFIDAQAGVPFVISISDSTSTDTTTALAQYTFTLEEDSTYQVIASGIVSPSGYSPSVPFDLHVIGSARETANNSMETDVLVYHGATDAPAVDVDETSVPAGILVDSLSYSEFAGYLSLATANYAIDIIDATNSQILVSYSAPLSNLNLGGEAITVIASGFVTPANNSNGAAFGLWASTAAGGPLVQLPVITSIDEIDQSLDNSISLYPNPSTGNVKVTFDGSDVIPQMIEVLDLTGKKVREIGVSSSTVQNLNLNDLPKGTYIVKMTHNNRFSAKKLILK